MSAANHRWCLRHALEFARMLPEAKRLKVLHGLIVNDTLGIGLGIAPSCRAARALHLRLIRECAEDGQVAVVWSGMDCDCVEYEGSVSIVPATVAEVDAHIKHTRHWADGPTNYDIMRPSDAARLTHKSRDLAAEAFEDGHPYHIRRAP